ncbi:MAG TPA: PH domain-containing protein [Coriobacteriia bacterium]
MTRGVTVAYIERELTEGERLVLMGRVSWWTIVPRTVLAIAVLVVAAVVAGMLGFLGDTVFWLVALPLTLLAWLALTVRQIMRVLSTEIAITDQRVMSKAGVFRTEVKTTPLDKVNNVNVSQSFFGNMLDYGDIEVTTATAEENDNHSIRALAHPDKFRNTLTKAPTV